MRDGEHHRQMEKQEQFSPESITPVSNITRLQSQHSQMICDGGKNVRKKFLSNLSNSINDGGESGDDGGAMITGNHLDRISKTKKSFGEILDLNQSNGIDQTNQTPSTSLTYLIVHHILRTLVLAVCIFGCMGQIISIMNIFFNYPAIVFVDLHQMERLTLPGITVCNNNRVMRSKLNAYDEKFAYKWNVLMNRSFDAKHNHQFKLYQQQLIDNLIRRMMTNLTVSQFMSFGNTADDFLDNGFFRCASDKNHPGKKCIYLSNLFTTAQENGNCFTLFHKSNSTELEEIAIESGLSESAVVRGLNNESIDIEMSLKPFAPNEIIRFRLNFQEDDYTTLNEPISGRFIIHDNNQIAVIREKSYRIRPGRYYIFYISRFTDKLLPAPYVTDCRDYDSSRSNPPKSIESSKTIEQDVSDSSESKDSNRLRRDLSDSTEMENQTSSSSSSVSMNILFRAPASKSNCVIGCLARKTIEKCNCWPPELPFFYNPNLNASENNLKWCDWREKPPIKDWKVKENNLTWFQFCFNLHEDACNQQCKADCRIDRYRIISEEIDWPSNERIEHSIDNGELRKLKSCCAVISIRYWSAEQKINEYKPRFEVAEFTSNIGGLLSMWLGFSLFGFYNLNEKFIVRLINYFWRRRKAQQQQQQTKMDHSLNDRSKTIVQQKKRNLQSYAWSNQSQNGFHHHHHHHQSLEKSRYEDDDDGFDGNLMRKISNKKYLQNRLDEAMMGATDSTGPNSLNSDIYRYGPQSFHNDYQTKPKRIRKPKSSRIYQSYYRRRNQPKS
ncbi:hypothetical protein NH340_JMT01493 [Sarcoptes scabiei]|nr:hypothetical protein NH340_JMT01493 [Sarcoptes scabiei]